jgi:hypothetical protein
MSKFNLFQGYSFFRVSATVCYGTGKEINGVLGA